jgi:hypothetical protein
MWEWSLLENTRRTAFLSSKNLWRGVEEWRKVETTKKNTGSRPAAAEDPTKEDRVPARTTRHEGENEDD